MPDIIQLLPDSVANQIAAGEVIQRPASALKELVENSIDAGATEIRVYVKEAGKVLLQVIDNGKGMSGTDARMSFERHATSKIKKAKDLFAIRTMGFRGEALASIAAIAHVEMKTILLNADIGTLLIIEGSEVKKQESCAWSGGTSISIKNLFYNIPARRVFLKSDPVEMRYILEEFMRISLANPELFFSLHHDANELFHLPQGTLKQRIVHLFGNSYKEKLVPVEEETSIISIKGFVGKPEFAKKTRGEQYFFVNNRFIKDPYLQHAVSGAYDELLPAESFPFFVLFIDIDPARIDINVHPTKTQIKFDDEKSIYAIIRSAVKQSLGKYNISPTLDFNTEHAFSNFGHGKNGNSGNAIPSMPQIKINSAFNPFLSGQGLASNSTPAKTTDFYGVGSATFEKTEVEQLEMNKVVQEAEEWKGEKKTPYQLHNQLILSPIKTGFIVIDQQAAHERILFERYMQQLNAQKGYSQQSLFPQTIDLSPIDFALIKELMPDLLLLGFDLREFGKGTFVIDGIPAESIAGNEKSVLEGLIENFKQNAAFSKLDRRENLAKSLAKKTAIRSGQALSTAEMTNLIDELFACKLPSVSIDAKPLLLTFGLDEIFKKFDKA